MNQVKAKNHRVWSCLIVLICLFVLISCSSKEPARIEVERTKEGEAQEKDPGKSEAPVEKESGGTAAESGREPSQTKPTSSSITVYVCGAVVQPGLYTLSAQARMMDAVTAAGGMTAQADQNMLNLAQFMTDGQMVRIPFQGEEPVGEAAGAQADGQSQDAQNSRVDLNSADVQQLMSVPGIGQSKAEAILQYRKENGRFDCIEDIMKVNGIKEGSFKKMEPYIYVK